MPTTTATAEPRRPPPGFRFFPTDAELILAYLRPKTLNLPLPPSTANFIAPVDIYAHPPWRLPALSTAGNRRNEWYFFATVDGGERNRRRTGEGFWKSISSDKGVFDGKRKVGVKKMLVYYSGQQGKGKRSTGWKMKEYRLDEEGGRRERGDSGPMYVVCRVYRKGRSKSAATAEDLGPTGGDLAVREEKMETNTTISSVLSSSKPNYLATRPFDPGFRFHPTDVELVSYYLKHKMLGLPINVDAIVEVDLYKWSPWDLPSLSHSSSVSRDLESYFFCSVDRNYCFSYVSHRVTPQGFWKTSGYDHPIYHATKIIGMRKTLIFHAGRNPCGQRTNWIMHEYRLEDGQSNSMPFGSAFVVCKIFLQKEYAPRRRRAKSGASFIEGEQVKTEQDLVLSGETSATPEVSKKNAQELDHIHTQGRTITMFDIGSHIEVANIKKDIPVAWYMAIILKVVNEKNFFVEYESLSKCDTPKRGIVSSQYIRPRHSRNLEVKSFALLDEVEAFYGNGWWPGVIAKVNDDSKYNVKFMHWEEEIEFSHNELRLLCDWVDGQWIQASQDKAVNLQNLEGSTSISHKELVHPSNISRKYKEPDLIFHSSGCEDETLCAVPISATNSENDNSETLTFKRELELLPCRQAENGEAMEDNIKIYGVRGTETSNASKTGFDVCTWIINEEPIVHIKALVEQWHAEFKKADASVVDYIPQTSSSILRPLQSIQQSVLLQNNEQRLELTHEHQSRGDEVARENIAGEKRRKDDRTRNLIIIDSLSEGDPGRKQRDNEVVDGPPIEGLSRSPRQSGTCSHNSLEAEDQSNVTESRSEEDENGVILSTTGKHLSKKARIDKSTNASEPCLDELLPKQSPSPFDKSSPMWNSVESLEIFRILPQQPHFRPLEAYNEEFREGMAIGLMVTFSNLVKSISNLQIDDSHDKFDEKLKTLVQLEEHGFNVHCIQARIIELLKMKENQERLVDEGARLEVLLVNKKRKKEQLHANIESVEKAARVLEVSLSHLYKEKSYILEQKRENESGFDKLEMDSRTVEEARLSSRNDFEATLSAAW